MKPYFSLFILFFLLGLAESIRLQQQEQRYWKHVMGDEPMPDAIKDLLPSTHEKGQDPVLRRGETGKEIKWEDLINKDFDTKSMAIIYHHHDDMNPHPHPHHAVDRPIDEAS